MRKIGYVHLAVAYLFCATSAAEKRNLDPDYVKLSLADQVKSAFKNVTSSFMEEKLNDMIINRTRQTQSIPLNFRALTTTNITLKTESTRVPLPEEGEKKNIGKGKRPYKDTQTKTLNRIAPNLMMAEDLSRVTRWDLMDPALIAADDSEYATEFNHQVSQVLKAYSAQGVGSGPFLACNRAKDYGVVRKTNLCDLMGMSDDSCDLIPINKNTESETCVTFSSSTEAIEIAAAACARDCTFLPLAPSFKFGAGLTEMIENLGTMKFSIELISGTDSSPSVQPDLYTIPPPQSNPAYFFARPQHASQDVIDSVLGYLLGNEGNETEADSRSPSRSRMLHSHYHLFYDNRPIENNNNMRRATSNNEKGELYEYSLYSRKLNLWRSAIVNNKRRTQQISTDPCVPYFLEMNLEADLKDPSTMTVELIAGRDLDRLTQDEELMKECAMRLVSALSLNADVATVSALPKLELHSTNPAIIGQNEMQWVIQSDVAGVRYFFDAGITGDGQVVGMSDTGLDTDNCYFAGNTYIDKDCGTGSGNNSHRKIVKYCPATDYKDGEGGHGTAVGSIIAGKRLGVSGYADG